MAGEGAMVVARGQTQGSRAEAGQGVCVSVCVYVHGERDGHNVVCASTHTEKEGCWWLVDLKFRSLVHDRPPLMRVCLCVWW